MAKDQEVHLRDLNISSSPTIFFSFNPSSIIFLSSSEGSSSGIKTIFNSSIPFLSSRFFHRFLSIILLPFRSSNSICAIRLFKLFSKVSTQYYIGKNLIILYKQRENNKKDQNCSELYEHGN